MQGPVAGAVTPQSALIWARASGKFDCYVLYDTDPELASPQRSATVTATKSNDYCMVFPLKGLNPATTYYYRLFVNDGPDKYFGGHAPFTIRTAPAGRTRFRVLVGSCARYLEDRRQPIWNVVGRLEPDLFFWMGDNIYGDSLDSDILAEEYRRQRDLPRLRPLMTRIPQLAIWDDHDYGLNNHDKTNPIKNDVLRVFKQYWSNPAFGLPETPGVFFQYHYGGVDYFYGSGNQQRTRISELSLHLSTESADK